MDTKFSCYSYGASEELEVKEMGLLSLSDSTLKPWASFDIDRQSSMQSYNAISLLLIEHHSDRTQEDKDSQTDPPDLWAVHTQS